MNTAIPAPFFIVIPKPPLLAVVIVPRGFCPKMRPC
ncbi:TPA: rfbP protein [Vibrio cholerae]|nr:rfbP protein [Vibrio cholerae]